MSTTCSWFLVISRTCTMKSLVFIFLCMAVFNEKVNCGHFINKFAVQISGGERVARSVAESHGYIHLGQIGSLEDHYLFEHPHVHRRSAAYSAEHHQKLSNHPQINWFEQQKVLSRKKRDFISQPVDVVENQEEIHRIQRREAREDLKFNDELWDKMWYFHGDGLNHTDMNVMGAWKRGVTGKDVVITILDDGIERNHEDLKDNYDPYASYDVNGHDSDPMPRYDYTNENRHGTRCAGEVSAKANNTKCVVGVAYNSKIGGVRMLDGDVYDAVEATSLSHNRSHIDIYSASWGPDDDGRVVDGPGVLAKKAFIDGVRLGRGGKGAIFVWASGNGGRQLDSCSCDGYTNSIYTMSISGISQRDMKPFYLEECASTLATTYSSGSGSEQKVITVDLHNKCTETHTGTSASAPLAAGIVALILEVNPVLTWRDVQYITLMTSRPLPDGAWTTNGVGRQVSLRYGYGLMDATAMVELAEKWTNVPTQHICEVQSKIVSKIKGKKPISGSGYQEMLDTDACAGNDMAVNFLEHVQAKITLKGKRRGDIVIHLTSPMGTRSTILPQRPSDGDSMKGFDGWKFLSVHFWGENPVGRWKLEVEVKKTSHGYVGGRYSGAQTANEISEWSLILHGTEGNPINLVRPTQKTKPTEQPTVPGNCNSQCLNGCSGPGANQCNACRSYRIDATGTCVQSCPNNYYAQGFLCKQCKDTCETCTYISSKQVMCLKCKTGYLLVEGKGTCVPFCEKGYYKDDDSHHCRVCSGMCSECTEDANKCTACRFGHQLFNNKCISEVKPCRSGQYMSESGCVTCPEGCFSCSSGNNCTCCNKGSYLQNGNCVITCDNGYLPFHVNYSSKFVFQQCKTCGNVCNVCPEGFTYVKGVCVQQSNCPEGTYFQWNSMSCKSCNTSCKSCIGPSYSDCLSCYPPYGYNNILRKCMKCCARTEIGSSNCCNCIEEGKCELPVSHKGDAQELFSVATTIVALLVSVLVALFVIIVIVVLMTYRKRYDHPDTKYSRLLEKENEEDA